MWNNIKLLYSCLKQQKNKKKNKRKLIQTTKTDQNKTQQLVDNNRWKLIRQRLFRPMRRADADFQDWFTRHDYTRLISNQTQTLPQQISLQARKKIRGYEK